MSICTRPAGASNSARSPASRPARRRPASATAVPRRGPCRPRVVAVSVTRAAFDRPVPTTARPGSQVTTTRPCVPSALGHAEPDVDERAAAQQPRRQHGTDARRVAHRAARLGRQRGDVAGTAARIRFAAHHRHLHGMVASVVAVRREIGQRVAAVDFRAHARQIAGEILAVRQRAAGLRHELAEHHRGGIRLGARGTAGRTHRPARRSGSRSARRCRRRAGRARSAGAAAARSLR